MKKYLVLILILFAHPVWAADTCSVSSLAELGNQSGKYEIVLTCTADTTATFSYTLTVGQMSHFVGKYGWTISSNSNTVNDGAELEVRDACGRVWLPASGNGNDFLDQDVYPATIEYFTGPNTDHVPVFSDDCLLTFYAENIGTSGGTINLRIALLD